MKEVSRAIILNQEGKVLLGRRTRGIGMGQYCLIGGKPDVGESAKEAVIREVREEIGVEFGQPQFYLRCLDNSTNDPWLVTYFTGIIRGEIRLELTEVEDIIFVSEDELDTLDIAFDQKNRLRDFFGRRRIDD
jgi:mutator protein MutT